MLNSFRGTARFLSVLYKICFIEFLYNFYVMIFVLNYYVMLRKTVIKFERLKITYAVHILRVD